MAAPKFVRPQGTKCPQQGSHAIRNFSLKIDLGQETPLHSKGFDLAIRSVGTNRVEAYRSLRVGDYGFHIAGRFYGFRNEQELVAWLGTFRPGNVGAWAQGGDGDFRIVVTDTNNRRAYLVSDRNGSARAYHAMENGVLNVAASRAEIIPLLKLRRICSFSLYSLLTIRYILDPYSLLEGVRVTMPGQVVAFDEFGAKTTNYYDPVKFEASYYETEQECLRALDAVTREILQKRCASEHEPCVLLSGGIDSVVILLYLTELLGRRIRTITFMVKGQERDETVPARIAARYYGSDHHVIRIDPKQGRQLYLQSLLESDTPQSVSLLHLPIRGYLESQAYSFDVFTGQDSRLHTPSFDRPKEIGLKLHQASTPPAFRRLCSAGALMLEHLPVTGSLRFYAEHWSRFLRPRGDLQSFIAHSLVGLPRPENDEEHTNGSFARLYKEVPLVEDARSWEYFFKKYVQFNYRAQCTDDMHQGYCDLSGPKTDLHHPFFDWRFVEASNRLPYRLTARRTFTLRSRSKMPVVQKYLLQQLVKGRVPDSLLYRQKQTNPCHHVFLNRSLRPLTDKILGRYLAPLLDTLEEDVRRSVTFAVERFRRIPRFVRYGEENLMEGIHGICLAALLNHLCRNPTTPWETIVGSLAETQVAV